jgi:hypothetical protein
VQEAEALRLASLQEQAAMQGTRQAMLAQLAQMQILAMRHGVWMPMPPCLMPLWAELVSGSCLCGPFLRSSGYHC